MSDQLALFDNPPTERPPKRKAEPVDQPLHDLIGQRPELERQLRVIRTLWAAHVPLITGARVVEHAGGHLWDADAALLAAEAAEWLYRLNTKAAGFIPKH